MGVARYRVLPVGIYAMKARIVADTVNLETLRESVAHIADVNFADHALPAHALRHVAITKGAFTPVDEAQLTGYITWCHTHVEDENVQALLLYAAFCILEDISFTRKDGQYLRWDARSGRSQGKNINKGRILTFREAIDGKLHQMVTDLDCGTHNRHFSPMMPASGCYQRFTCTKGSA